MFAPASRAKPILTKVHGAATKALEAPDVLDRLKTLGYEVVGGTPEELGEDVRREITKWGPPRESLWGDGAVMIMPLSNTLLSRSASPGTARRMSRG